SHPLLAPAAGASVAAPAGHRAASAPHATCETVELASRRGGQAVRSSVGVVGSSNVDSEVRPEMARADPGMITRRGQRQSLMRPCLSHPSRWLRAMVLPLPANARKPVRLRA